MSRLTNDVENISNVLIESVTQFISSALEPGRRGGHDVCAQLRLALVSLITLPLMMLLSRLDRQAHAQGLPRTAGDLGELNGIIEETITGQRVVKAYVREQTVDRASLTSPTASCATRVDARPDLCRLMGPLMNLVNNIGFAIVAGAGGWMAVQGMATVGTIASFISYARQFSRPLNQIANLYNSIQSAIAGAERVFEIMDEVPELADAPDALPLEQVAGDVVFDDVCFGYEPGRAGAQARQPARRAGPDRSPWSARPARARRPSSTC